MRNYLLSPQHVWTSNLVRENQSVDFEEHPLALSPDLAQQQKSSSLSMQLLLLDLDVVVLDSHGHYLFVCCHLYNNTSNEKYEEIGTENQLLPIRVSLTVSVIVV